MLALTCGARGSNVGDDFFSNTNPLHLDITISTNYFSSLNARSRDYAPVLAEVRGQVPVSAGLRLRGVSSFQRIERKPAFALKLTEENARRQFDGLSKILVNNCAADACCMREHVACSLFRAAGVPVARTRPLRVAINGRDIGICLAMEAMNKDFLRRNFGDASGNLYEGTTRDIDRPLELDNGRDESGDDLRELLAATQEPDLTKRVEKLEGVLDIDRFLKFAAVQVFLGHVDGYLGNRNNFRIYHDRASGRMVFMPHGLDTTFMRGSDLAPSTNNIVMRALYSVPDIRRRYIATCNALVRNVFEPAFMSNEVHHAWRTVKALAGGSAGSERVSGCTDFLMSQFMGRREEVLSWLSDPDPKVLSLTTGQETMLTNWTSFVRFGTPKTALTTNAGGAFLRIEAANTAGAGWRCRAVFPEGEYKFSSRVLAKALRQSPTDQAPPPLLFRIEGELGGATLLRAGEWETLEYRFVALPEGRLVEFLCELQNGTGDIWIDLDSLKVRRVHDRH